MAKVWRSVCGLIFSLQARAARVALDDLVEALAGEARAAAVDEQPRLPDLHTDERRASRGAVGAQRGDRLAADRHEPLL